MKCENCGTVWTVKIVVLVLVVLILVANCCLCGTISYHLSITTCCLCGIDCFLSMQLVVCVVLLLLLVTICLMQFVACLSNATCCLCFIDWYMCCIDYHPYFIDWYPYFIVYYIVCVFTCILEHCQWLESQQAASQTCPVCKAGIERDKIIPIYGRGKSAPSADVNQAPSGSESSSIPNRPMGQRPPAPVRVFPVIDWPNKLICFHIVYIIWLIDLWTNCAAQSKLPVTTCKPSVWYVCKFAGQ